jgi:hypothetical protein
MIVAMVAVGMMQMPVDQIVDMIPMRHGLMPAPGPVNMSGRMSGTLMLRRAHIRVLRRDLDGVLVHVPRVHVVQMTIMKIIDVVAMLHSRMPAARPVLVRVVLMVRKFAVAHSMAPRTGLANQARD